MHTQRINMLKSWMMIIRAHETNCSRQVGRKDHAAAASKAASKPKKPAQICLQDNRIANVFFLQISLPAPSSSYVSLHSSKQPTNYDSDSSEPAHFILAGRPGAKN